MAAEPAPSATIKRRVDVQPEAGSVGEAASLNETIVVPAMMQPQ